MRKHQWLLSTIMVCAVVAQLACTGDSGKETSEVAIDDIVAAVIEAYGGEKALRSIRGYYMAGNQFATQSRQPIRVLRWFARPDRLRLELAYPDHHETRYTDGVRGWAGSSGDDIRPANQLKLQAMRLQTLRLDLPLRLLEYRDDLQLEAPDEEGRVLIRLPLDSGLALSYHIHPQSHRIERISMSMPGPPEMQFGADYSQFHEIDGVLIHFREVTFAGDTETSQFQVSDFRWNPRDLEESVSPGMKAWD